MADNLPQYPLLVRSISGRDVLLDARAIDDIVDAGTEGNPHTIVRVLRPIECEIVVRDDGPELFDRLMKTLGVTFTVGRL